MPQSGDGVRLKESRNRSVRVGAAVDGQQLPNWLWQVLEACAIGLGFGVAGKEPEGELASDAYCPVEGTEPTRHRGNDVRLWSGGEAVAVDGAGFIAAAHVLQRKEAAVAPLNAKFACQEVAPVFSAERPACIGLHGLAGVAVVQRQAQRTG
jgi:hypothetical protein